MKIKESILKFDLDKKYSPHLRSFIKTNVITKIKEVIKSFLEKDLSERKYDEYYEFKDQFEQYFWGGEFTESDIVQFSIGEKIEICRLADDTGFFQFELSNVSYTDLPNMITSDCCFSLIHLVTEEALVLIHELEKSMKKTGLKLRDIIDMIYLNLRKKVSGKKIS